MELVTIGYVDLDKKDVTVDTLTRDRRYRFLGGGGINAYLFLRHSESGIPPLDSNDAIVLGSGILSGLGAGPMESAAFSTRFPLTYRFESETIPGGFGAGMRWAGFDHIVLTGKAKRPVFIALRNGGITLESAGALKKTGAAEFLERIGRKEGFQGIRGLAIGPEGENRLHGAKVFTHDGRIFGASGAGAALGAKNVKAVICTGTRDLPVKHPQKLLDLLKGILEQWTVLPDSSRFHEMLPKTSPEIKDTGERKTAAGVPQEMRCLFEKKGMRLPRDVVFESIAHCLGLGFLRAPETESETEVLTVIGNLIRFASGLVFHKTQLVDAAFRVHALNRLIRIRDEQYDSRAAPFSRGVKNPAADGWDKRSLMRLKVFKALGIEDLWPGIREQEKRRDG
ncbi:MAG: hypothetical protein JRJ54_13935 [Deltaproteobacteria bacterium]|nr:hypothetical protein [Deltaproteobacteria bacterium]